MWAQEVSMLVSRQLLTDLQALIVAYFLLMPYLLLDLYIHTHLYRYVYRYVYIHIIYIYIYITGQTKGFIGLRLRV